MKLSVKTRNVLRGLKQSWGTSRIKRSLWNKEFAEGHWDFIENTADDIVYPYIEKYSRNGSILDLGCGSGNTGCELNSNSYREYTGVDISDVALRKASERSRTCGRAQKNHYVQHDIASYSPIRKYDVILFRESIYYIPRIRIKGMLERYARYLEPEGVFIVRWHDSKVGSEIVDFPFRVIEKYSTAGGPCIVVFRTS